MMAPKRDLSSLTTTLESTPSGAMTAVAAAAGQVGREELHAQGGDGGAGHLGDGLCVLDELLASCDEVSGGVLRRGGLVGDVVQRRAECGDERDGRGVGALAELGVLALLAQIEVVARIVAGLHAVPGALADGEVAEAGRDHDCLLRAADEDVDAELVHVDVGGAEAGDGVDDEEGFGVGFLEQLGDGAEAVARAGGGLGGLHKDDAGFEAAARP